eukprot:TRINITY_DN17585_c0_g1_i1.p2 TRINITY_DN17585_c0_g1~~TRINITY_DN17585_c0_g1_i1.p2  ORF type:complete len:166 (+),score=43.32 TRINITY_DN17585_c0_g1_i1:67-564(+)
MGLLHVAIGIGALPPLVLLCRRWLRLPWYESKHSHPIGERRPNASADYKKRKCLAEAMTELAPKTGKKYLIIGTGSVGVAIMDALLERGESEVRGFDVAAPRRVVPSASSSALDAEKSKARKADILGRVTQGDVTDYAAIKLRGKTTAEKSEATGSTGKLEACGS